MQQLPYHDAHDAWEGQDESDQFLSEKRTRKAQSPWWRLAKVVVGGGALFLTGLGVGLEVTSRDTRHESRLTDDAATE